jgi:hypothetical protein
MNVPSSAREICQGRKLIVVSLLLFFAPLALRGETFNFQEYEYWDRADISIYDDAPALEGMQDVAVSRETGEVFILDNFTYLQRRVSVFRPHPNYEWVRDIPLLFLGFVGPVHAIAVHGDRLYVTGEQHIQGSDNDEFFFSDGIAIYSTEGEFIRFIRLTDARDLDVDDNGFIYVIQERQISSNGYTNVLRKLDPEGRTVAVVTKSNVGFPGEQLFGELIGVAVDSKKSYVYLTDRGWTQDGSTTEDAVHLIKFDGDRFEARGWMTASDWGFGQIRSCEPGYVSVDSVGVAYVGMCGRYIVRVDDALPPGPDATVCQRPRFRFDDDGNVLSREGSCSLEHLGSLPSIIDFSHYEGLYNRPNVANFRLVDGSRRLFVINQFQEGVDIFAPTDSDGDGLLDKWEREGVNGVDLPGMGADPNHKDLFVEIDWLPQNPPSRLAIQNLKRAFAAAPVDAGRVLNPDGKPGINLWVDTGFLEDRCMFEDPPRIVVGEVFAGSCYDGKDNAGDGVADRFDTDCDVPRTEVNKSKELCASEVYSSDPHTCHDGIDNDGDGVADNRDADCTVGDSLGHGQEIVEDTDGDGQPGPICFEHPGVPDTFRAIKSTHFDPARAPVFRYVVYGSCPAIRHFGEAELGGDDVAVYRGDRTGKYLAHEFAHALNLEHGGDEDVHKPNHVSSVSGDVRQYDPELPEGGGKWGSCGNGKDDDNDGTADRDDSECRKEIIDLSPPRFPEGRGRAPYPTVKEDDLSEGLVLDETDKYNFFTLYHRGVQKGVFPVNAEVDWNQNGVKDSVVAPIDLDNDQDTDSVLRGFNDWDYIRMNFRLEPASVLRSGVAFEEPELTDRDLAYSLNVRLDCDDGDLDCDGDVDVEDVVVLVSRLGSNAFGDMDPFDLDEDGVITEKDVEALKSQCTRGGCVPFCDVSSEPDRDGDGVADRCDNCPSNPNPDQADGDSDGAGDICDAEDGWCGGAINQGTLTAPTSELCLVGYPTEPVALSGVWSWLCVGLGDGEDASCSVPGANTGNGGSATLKLEADGDVCKLLHAAVVEPRQGGPNGIAMPFKAFEFTAGDQCAMVTVQLTVNDDISSMELWKDLDGSWILVTDATVDGATATFIVDDNGDKDADDAVGSISDPFSLGFARGGAATPIAAISWAGLVALTMSLMALGWFFVRRRH